MVDQEIECKTGGDGKEKNGVCGVEDFDTYLDDGSYVMRDQAYGYIESELIVAEMASFRHTICSVGTEHYTMRVKQNVKRLLRICVHKNSEVLFLYIYIFPSSFIYNRNPRHRGHAIFPSIFCPFLYRSPRKPIKQPRLDPVELLFLDPLPTFRSVFITNVESTC